MTASDSQCGDGGPSSESEEGRQGTWRGKQKKRRYKVFSSEGRKFRK